MLGAGVVHAGWNAVLKSVDDRLVAFTWIGLVSSAAGLVGLVVTGLPPADAVLFAVASAVVHIAYDLSLISAYRVGSFSQMYPIARGTAPLLVTVGAVLFAHEHPGGLALTGIVVLAAGLTSLAVAGGRIAHGDLPAVGLALLTGVTIAGYTLVDGLGVRHSPDPFAYISLLFATQGPLLVATVRLRRPGVAVLRAEVRNRAVVAGAMSITAYAMVMWAQTRAPLGEVSALRETGVISASLIGAVVFRERFGARMVAAAAVVALGIVLIAW